MLRDGAITTVDGGYALDVQPSDVDVRRFEASLVEGRRLADEGDHAGTVDHLRSAEALWRGPPFADVTSCAPLDLAAITLAEGRLGALELMYRSALLAEAEVSELNQALEQLVSEQPLRESFTELLMRALCLSGRPTDAGRRYEELRRRLADELGLTPSPARAAVELAILTHDDSLASTRSERGAATAWRPSTPLTSFIGRADERVLERCRDHRLVTVVGPGGARKSRLVTELFDVLETNFQGRAQFVPLAELEIPESVPARSASRSASTAQDRRT